MTAEMEEEEKKTTATMWTTWEELLLACAVKRHGLNNWDTVAMEIQTRTSPSLANSYMPEICRNKYVELKSRFESPNSAVDDGSVPWVEELRKLRVAQLTKDVQRYDRSIQSLQLKVERLEQEREHSRNERKGPDPERSENVKIDADRVPAAALPANTDVKDVSGEYSNRSINESNSSENREVAGGERNSESEVPGQTTGGNSGNMNPDPKSKTVREESCNDSSDTVAKYLISKTRYVKKKDSNELRNSDEASESKEGGEESSDVQSSASLTKKKRRKISSGGGGDNKEEPVVVSTATMATTAKREVVVVKSEPLVAVMDIIRSHKHGSMFERRLDRQKTDKYNKIVRQHVDLRTVQTRIDDGSYSSCTNKFFLDLLLIFNNAIVYFPKQSTESMAAHELRVLVLKEMRKKPKKPDPTTKSEPISLPTKPNLERSDSLLAKQKSTAPIVVCRKRSSISGKPSSSNKASVEKEKELVAAASIPKPQIKTSSNEDEHLLTMNIKEKPVTGVRSMRRSGNSSRLNSTSYVAPSKNQITSSSSNPANSTSKGSDGQGNVGPPKVEKKKAAEVTPVVKKRGAADFLKRLKKNSPAKGNAVEEDGGRRSKNDPVKQNVEERKEGTPARQKGGGSGRQVKKDVSPSKKDVGGPAKKGKEVVPAKRGRETVEPESASKRPVKRSRR